MKSRREFLKSATVLGVASVVDFSEVPSVGQPIAGGSEPMRDRDYWLDSLKKIATPVLKCLAHRELKKKMPVEAANSANPSDRAKYTHLEAFGRLLAGIAPWLAAEGLVQDERAQHQKLVELAQMSLDAATDPSSPDFMNFYEGAQPVVDAAFMAQGILRAPTVLWQSLETRVRKNVVEALKSSRAIKIPSENNWVMFAATIEAALLMMGEKTNEDRLEGSVRRMLGCYKGDGIYGDGEFFHFDYYNSFVIHPMLVDVLLVLQQKDSRFEPVFKIVLERARRYGEIQERLIAPDGTFPSIGRSTTYRFGALQVLAQIALLGQLTKYVRPAQVRCAMTSVIRKMIESPGTFDEAGWLRIGFCGHQPSLAEPYISTGSLYLCSTGFLPLGLPAADEFWSGPAAQWTQQCIWSGGDVPADHAIRDVKNVDVPSYDTSKAER
jgi:hypothetical protein